MSNFDPVSGNGENKPLSNRKPHPLKSSNKITRQNSELIANMIDASLTKDQKSAFFYQFNILSLKIHHQMN